MSWVCKMSVKYAIAAGAAAFWQIMGQIAAASASTLNIPEGLVNIGGNGCGYILNERADWDPTSADNQDGTLDSLALGDNVSLYAIPGSDGRAGVISSLNSTYPDGYSSLTSRKIGGYHYGRVREVADRYDTSVTLATQIVPNSVWDLSHRPTCSPVGMAEIIPGAVWVDIYHNSEGSGIWPQNVPVSAYGVTPITDDVYARTDFGLLAGNAGKRLPTVSEFCVYADGAPQGSDSANTAAWAATTNTGPTTTGAVAQAVSTLNIIDAAGNLWDWLDDQHDLGDTYAWSTSVVDVGKDAAYYRGAVYHAGWRAFVGGGTWCDGAHCGARCLFSNAGPWDASGHVGLRCACGAL
jgi:hypothetical protein